MMAYYNARGNIPKSDFFQKRIKHLLSLKQVDEELESNARRSALGFSKNMPPLPRTVEHKKQVTIMLNKNHLDAHLKDKLIDKDLMLQESRIGSR
jgi:hypothetical protein